MIFSQKVGLFSILAALAIPRVVYADDRPQRKVTQELPKIQPVQLAQAQKAVQSYIDFLESPSSLLVEGDKHHKRCFWLVRNDINVEGLPFKPWLVIDIPCGYIFPPEASGTLFKTTDKVLERGILNSEEAAYKAAHNENFKNLFDDIKRALRAVLINPDEFEFTLSKKGEVMWTEKALVKPPKRAPSSPKPAH